MATSCTKAEARDRKPDEYNPSGVLQSQSNKTHLYNFAKELLVHSILRVLLG